MVLNRSKCNILIGGKSVTNTLLLLAREVKGMSLFFIFSLATFLVAVYIFKVSKNSADEIAYLAASIALVSLVVSLVLAPWPVQLLLLVLVLLKTRQYLLLSEGIVESQEEEKTELSYRGANYEPTPPKVELTEAEITGKYRGQVWKSRNLVHPGKSD